MSTPAVAETAPRHVPCPLCGGLIHPIASRCKHCRAAIADHGARRRSGVAGLRTLPALTATPLALGLPSSTLAVALPVPAEPAYGATVATSFDFADADNRPWWKRWPMIVVAIATVAIVVAVILMVWPQNQRRGTNVVAPPAPANMDTNPMPETPPSLPPASTDPWSGTGPAVPAPIDPSTDPSMPVPGADPGAPSPTPDPDLDVDPDPDPDPNGPAAPPVNSSARDQFVNQLATAVCRQVADCTNIDPAMTNVLCDGVVSLLNQTLPSSNCSFNAGKAAICLKRVRTLTCNSQLSVIDAVALLNDLPACVEALHC